MKYPENKVGQPISKTSFNNNWLLVCGKEVSENAFFVYIETKRERSDGRCFRSICLHYCEPMTPLT
jgi:hypothetical protein